MFDFSLIEYMFQFTKNVKYDNTNQTRVCGCHLVWFGFRVLQRILIIFDTMKLVLH